MRLQFWNDAVNKVYDKDKSKPIPEHPVILEVNNVRHCVPDHDNYLMYQNSNAKPPFHPGREPT